MGSMAKDYKEVITAARVGIGFAIHDIENGVNPTGRLKDVLRFLTETLEGESAMPPPTVQPAQPDHRPTE